MHAPWPQDTMPLDRLYFRFYLSVSMHKLGEGQGKRGREESESQGDSELGTEPNTGFDLITLSM